MNDADAVATMQAFFMNGTNVGGAVIGGIRFSGVRGMDAERAGPQGRACARR